MRQVIKDIERRRKLFLDLQKGVQVAKMKIEDAILSVKKGDWDKKSGFSQTDFVNMCYVFNFVLPEKEDIEFMFENLEKDETG